MVQYEWLPYNKTAPRRKPVWKIVLNYLKAQWATEYRDTTATEGAAESEHVIKPYNLRDEIAWGVSFKHFDYSPERCTLTAYIDDKYNDFTEEKHFGGESRMLRFYVCVDMAYRFTEHITKLDDDNYPIQFEGNKIMIDNILSDCSALSSQGLHYIYKGRTVFDGRFSDEEIFLERLSREASEKVKDIDNDAIWIYRKIFNVEYFEKLKLY